MRGREIRTVADLLQKYKQLKAPQGAVIDALCTSVAEVLGVTLTKECVSYNPHTRVAHVAVSGPLKQEIRIAAQKIIARSRDILGGGQGPCQLT